MRYLNRSRLLILNALEKEQCHYEALSGISDVCRCCTFGVSMMMLFVLMLITLLLIFFFDHSCEITVPVFRAIETLF